MTSEWIIIERPTRSYQVNKFVPEEDIAKAQNILASRPISDTDEIKGAILTAFLTRLSIPAEYEELALETISDNYIGELNVLRNQTP